ncbi:hypothetical protein MUP01_14010 [Candidatus Bathyarchaeota archaeon]|nr:hypothetical protein [Candidatus Bathyarchaeota archaeon]
MKEQREAENPKPLREKYMSWEEFHEKQPLLSYREFLELKTEHERPCPPCSETFAVPKEIKGAGIWSEPDDEDDETEWEKRARRKREAEEP